MLKSVSDGPAIVICNTCRHSEESSEDQDGVRGGARLVAAIREAAADDARYAAIDVQEMPCLFACKDFCTVHLRAPGKVGYVLGRFAPDSEAATAILEYAVRYAASEFGQVPFRDWPKGVKGHFIVRTPPAGQVVA